MVSTVAKGNGGEIDGVCVYVRSRSCASVNTTATLDVPAQFSTLGLAAWRHEDASGDLVCVFSRLEQLITFLLHAETDLVTRNEVWRFFIFFLTGFRLIGAKCVVHVMYIGCI